MNPKVSIIILNWNGWKDTTECLESLYQITYPNYDVIVVDNGSEDDSIKKIKEYCEGKIKVKSKFFVYNPSNKPIKYIEYTREEAEAGKEIDDLPSNRKLIIIKNEKNYGFAEGNNIGMRYALTALNLNPDYVLLLNNDTVVDKKFLSELVKVADENENIGILGPKICYYVDPEKIQSMGGNMSLWTGRLHYIINYHVNDAIKADMVNGAAFLIKKGVIQTVGLLDLDYFLYSEETDFCFRAKKHDFHSVCVPNSKIWHKIFASSGGKPRGILLYYWTRNLFLFMKKNAARRHWLTFLIFFIKDRSVYIILKLLRGDLDTVKYVIKGLVDGIKGKTGKL